MQLANITAELQGVPLMSTSCHTVTSMNLLSWVNGGFFHIYSSCMKLLKTRLWGIFIYLFIYSNNHVLIAELKKTLPGSEWVFVFKYTHTVVKTRSCGTLFKRILCITIVAVILLAISVQLLVNSQSANHIAASQFL